MHFKGSEPPYRAAVAVALSSEHLMGMEFQLEMIFLLFSSK